jgi:hypothetical protein
MTGLPPLSESELHTLGLTLGDRLWRLRAVWKTGMNPAPDDTFTSLSLYSVRVQIDDLVSIITKLDLDI